MTKQIPTNDHPPPATPRQTAKVAHLAREAAALRANLHKRKDQARAQTQKPPAPDQTDP